MRKDKFKEGDEVYYIHYKGDKTPAKVVEMNKDGLGMWVSWHQDSFPKIQLMPCNRFEMNKDLDES